MTMCYCENDDINYICRKHFLEKHNNHKKCKYLCNEYICSIQCMLYSEYYYECYICDNTYCVHNLRKCSYCDKKNICTECCKIKCVNCGNTVCIECHESDDDCCSEKCDTCKNDVCINCLEIVEYPIDADNWKNYVYCATCYRKYTDSVIIIQRNCYNWLWKPKCDDGTIGIQCKIGKKKWEKYFNE